MFCVDGRTRHRAVVASKVAELSKEEEAQQRTIVVLAGLRIMVASSMTVDV